MPHGPSAAMDAVSPIATVIGEALIDLVPLAEPGTFQAKPGGSPFNVAIGLARLGHRTALMARLAEDSFGRILRRHAEAEGIDLTAAPHAAEPTTLAVITMNAHAQPGYSFYHQGTADWQWRAPETEQIPENTAILHLGSAASWTAPGDVHLHTVATRLHDRGDVLISYDPNIRPGLLGTAGDARHLIERTVAIAHVVKASREDIDWLYPGSDVQDVAAHWTGLGASAVVITDGAEGASWARPGQAPVHQPGMSVAVRDTVGAGDAFTAGLLGALLRTGLHTPAALRACPPAALVSAVDQAILISALTCQRLGADPPVALPRPGVPAHVPLTIADLRFKENRSDKTPRSAAGG